MHTIKWLLVAGLIGTTTAACTEQYGYPTTAYNSGHYNAGYYNNGSSYGSTPRYYASGPAYASGPGYAYGPRRRGANGDYDRDGIPNKYDRDANGNGIPDHYER